MSVNTGYNFPEAKLGPNFAKENLKNFRQLIDANLSFVVVSLPGVGVSCFLKYLAVQDFARFDPARRARFDPARRARFDPARRARFDPRQRRGSPEATARRATFIHVDLYSLPSLSLHEFYKLLLSELGGNPFDYAQGKTTDKTEEKLLSEIRDNLKALAQKRGKIVIIFSRFDQLKNQFNSTFLSNIQSLAAQSLTTISQNPIVEIFTSTKPLYEIAPDALTGGNLNFYSENLYFKPYSKDDLKKLLKVDPARPVPAPVLNELLDLSGGHNQLFRILLSSQKQQNLLLDNFVKMQMKELVDNLDYQQRKQVQKIALGKSVTEVDEYLLGVGMIRQSTSETIHLEGEENARFAARRAITPSRWKTKEFELFTPLLTDYIKTNMPVKLPVKETRLFKLLKDSIGKTVPKDEIFAEVWGDKSEDATDWALDALIYRLRKHPFMQAHGYIIESHKKVGYTLIQI